MSNKILICDDEDHIRQFMKINLEYAGFDIVEAGTGEEALKMADEEKPSVFILDIMLPGISGYEVCDTIRKNILKLG